jgi:protein-tyrosine phosphatase
MDQYIAHKRKNWVYFLTVITIVLVSISVAYVYNVYFSYRFTVVSDNKVYRSGKMPSEELQKKVKQYGIKTVIDLRNQGDDHNDEIEKEHVAMEQVGVNHINLASKQVPQDETIDKFLKIMQEKKNLPVLIHCYHGVGRAVLYSGVYLIEFEGWSNDEARKASRLITTWKSSFSTEKEKGKYLMNYRRRLT